MAYLDIKKAPMACGRLALEDPNFRTDVQLRAIRSFRGAAQQMLQCKDRQVSCQLLQHHPFQMYSASAHVHVYQRARHMQ